MFRFLQVVAFVATVDDVPEQVQAQQVSLFGSGLECTGYTALSRVYSLPSCQTGPWETLLGPYQDMNIVYTQIPTWRGKQIYVRLSVGNRRATLAVSRFTAYNIICSSDIYSLRPISIWGRSGTPFHPYCYFHFILFSSTYKVADQVDPSTKLPADPDSGLPHPQVQLWKRSN